MLLGTAWLSRVGTGTGYLTGVALPMIVFGVGQGLGLSSLTTAGMAGVEHQDAGVAGGLVNVAHHLGGAVGLAILTTLFDAAGGGLAHQVSVALSGAAVFVALALTVTVVTARPARSRIPATTPA
jgi:sugar phosphate permease